MTGAQWRQFKFCPLLITWSSDRWKKEQSRFDMLPKASMVCWIWSWISTIKCGWTGKPFGRIVPYDVFYVCAKADRCLSSQSWKNFAKRDVVSLLADCRLAVLVILLYTRLRGWRHPGNSKTQNEPKPPRMALETTSRGELTFKLYFMLEKEYWSNILLIFRWISV